MQPLIWVDRFLSLPSSQYLVRVTDSFLTDFLSHPNVPETPLDVDAARSIILDPSHPADDSAQADAAVLYGLAHLEFLQTEAGLALVHAKAVQRVFPHCPRIFCRRTVCLPCGTGPELHDNPVRMFCPTCREIYKIGNAATPGAFFGMSYIKAMIAAYPDLALDEPVPAYVPRIFGFRLLERPERAPEEDALP